MTFGDIGSWDCESTILVLRTNMAGLKFQDSPGSISGSVGLTFVVTAGDPEVEGTARPLLEIPDPIFDNWWVFSFLATLECCCCETWRWWWWYKCCCCWWRWRWGCVRLSSSSSTIISSSFFTEMREEVPDITRLATATHRLTKIERLVREKKGLLQNWYIKKKFMKILLMIALQGKIYMIG